MIACKLKWRGSLIAAGSSKQTYYASVIDEKFTSARPPTLQSTTPESEDYGY